MENLGFAEPVWIGAAMAAGLLLGRLLPELDDALDAVKVGQTSLPIALGLLLMMYPVPAKVRYREVGLVTSDKRMTTASLPGRVHRAVCTRTQTSRPASAGPGRCGCWSPAAPAFVASHTVATVLKDNHDVRLPVRRAARISPALRPLGVSSDVEHIVGDATDAKTVEHALDGCEAVVHAVVVFNLVPPGRRPGAPPPPSPPR